MPVFLIFAGTLQVRALLKVQFSFILLGRFLVDDLQVPSSAPGKARFFGLFSFFVLVRLVRFLICFLSKKSTVPIKIYIWERRVAISRG